MPYDLMATLVTTTDATIYTTPSFSPPAGSLLIMMSIQPDRWNGGGGDGSAPLAISDSEGGFYNPVSNNSWNDQYWLHRWSYICGGMRTAAVSGAPMTVTLTSGYTEPGVVLVVYAVRNPTAFGISAVRQFATSGTNYGDPPHTPVCTFGSACLSSSIIFGVVGCDSNPPGISPPAGFTEDLDAGISTPTRGAQFVALDLGFTGTVITWPGVLPTVGRAYVMEIRTNDVYVPPTAPPPEIEIIGINSYEIKVLTGR